MSSTTRPYHSLAISALRTKKGRKGWGHSSTVPSSSPRHLSQRLHSIGDTAEAQAAHHSSISRSKCVSLQWSRPYRLSIPIFSGTLSRLIPLFHEGKNWDLGQKKRIILLFPSEKKTIYTYQLAPLFSGIK